MTSGYRRRRVDITFHLAIFLLIVNSSSTSQKDKYVILHFFFHFVFCFVFFLCEPKKNAHNVSAFKDQLR